MRSSYWAGALAVGYLAVACTWILVSSSVAATSSHSVEDLQRFEMMKGVAYVGVTAVGLFFAARFALRRIERSASELLHRERMLVASERRVFAGLIAGSVAHDANNVLSVVLADLADLDAPGSETVARLRTSIDRLIDLNRRLVQAVRQSTATLFSPIDLTAAVRDALDFVRGHPALHKVKLTVAADMPVDVVATPVLISQIVTNLVVNAGEATGGAGRVVVTVRREGDAAILEVEDDGPGIPPERRAGLFDALASTKPEGNGLGLFSVKAAVGALGGTVVVDASPMGGARFVVKIDGPA